MSVEKIPTSKLTPHFQLSYSICIFMLLLRLTTLWQASNQQVIAAGIIVPVFITVGAEADAKFNLILIVCVWGKRDFKAESFILVQRIRDLVAKSAGKVGKGLPLVKCTANKDILFERNILDLQIKNKKLRIFGYAVKPFNIKMSCRLSGVQSSLWSQNRREGHNQPHWYHIDLCLDLLFRP